VTGGTRHHQLRTRITFSLILERVTSKLWS